MVQKLLFVVMFLTTTIFINSCKQTEKKTDEKESNKKTEIQMKVEQYAKVKLTSDLSVLSENQKKMLPILFEVADIMDDLFWKDAIGNKEEFLNSIEDEAIKQFAMINYGPWNRMDGDKPFIEGYGEKPPGANYYPKDITKEEFEAWEDKDKTSWYTLVRRDDNGKLINVPYHVEYKTEIEKAATLLKKAAELADDPGFNNYLELRAEALLTDDYLASDLAWMDMKDNIIDFVVGPIESYEDQLFGCRAAHSGQILIKDIEWSKKLERFGELLPKLQASLPCDEKYKQEKARTNSDMNVYDVIYYAGDCNAAGKNIAINLPNDPRVHEQKGSRKLQLQNAMKAKFDKILVPISDVLMAEDQRQYVKFDAFFENVMFHEVGHGLGIKNTINGKGTVRDALKEHYSAIEENKADILGLFLVSKLYEMGEYPEKDLMDNFVTFMAGIFRSVRFGVASAHGKANMMRFYYFQEQGAFNRDETTGTYSVNFEKMKEAMNSLADMILTIQGEGDYEASKKLIDEKGFIREDLQKDLDRLNEAGIPIDIVFEQGIDVLGI
ncbi:MAG: Zn-dependent hydrolase [Bacteroidales bacterium]|nr:Zn-dependent hydrolase [Bacteroidales bacterium]